MTFVHNAIVFITKVFEEFWGLVEANGVIYIMYLMGLIFGVVALFIGLHKRFVTSKRNNDNE